MGTMTALYALKAIKRVIEQKVASSLLLPKEKSSPVEYVHPYVALITLPHKNFMPVNFQCPHILVGLVSGEQDSQQGKLSIRIACATYGGDIKFEEDANIPDDTGYIDLINLIERVKEELQQSAVIDGCGLVDTNSFSYGIYDEEITYPYWYGYLQFSLDIPTNARQMTEFL